MCVGRMCLTRDSSSFWSWLPRSKSHCAHSRWATDHPVILTWGVNLWSVRKKEKAKSLNWIFLFLFFFLNPRYIFRCLQWGEMGSVVYVFPCLQRCFSHRHTHTHALTQAAGGHCPLIRGFDWFKPPCDQQSSLPKCPWARHYLYHPGTLISDPTYWGTVECFQVM